MAASPKRTPKAAAKRKTTAKRTSAAKPKTAAKRTSAAKRKTTAKRPSAAKRKTTAKRPSTAKRKTTAKRPSAAKRKTTAKRPSTAKPKTAAKRPSTAKPKTTAKRPSAAKRKTAAKRPSAAKRKTAAKRPSAAKPKTTAKRPSTAKPKTTAKRPSTAVAPSAPPKLPEVLASDVPILLMWRATATGSDLSMVENRLSGFNDKLYECTDEQWRVGRFLIQDSRSELSPTGAGVGRIHRTVHQLPHGDAEGRPNRPEYWDAKEDSQAGTYLSEFLHSWAGLKAEDRTGRGGETHCPLPKKGQRVTPCVMDSALGAPAQLCRPNNHNPNTEQGSVRGMDCYSWLDRVMREAGKQNFQVPSTAHSGPIKAPKLQFVYLTIRRVKQIDSPDGWLGRGDFYAIVRMGGTSFAWSKREDGQADFSPNWLFGLAFSSKTAAKVPIRIEIWDHDSLSSDDLCDASPVKGRKSLDLQYDTATKKFAGDVSGNAGTPTTVKGVGDGDRVEITFEVTSR